MCCDGKTYILAQRMFVSRTVAAEVCMEAKINEQGYLALRKLDAARKLPYTIS